MGTSHEDLHVFLEVEVTGWGISSQPHYRLGKSPWESSVMMLSPNQTHIPDTPIMQRLFTLDNFNLTGSIHKIKSRILREQTASCNCSCYL
jgi:hypothetical protein